MKNFIFLLILASAFSLSSQNLLPNGDFETINYCPTNFNQVTAVASWSASANNHNPAYGAEYMNNCAQGTLFGLPDNHFGYQPAHSGNGYMAPVTLAPTVGQNYRENVYTKLISPLVAGASYSISLYVSHTDNSQNSSNNMGIKFSSVPDFPINNISHLYSQTVISDTSNWISISGVFVADSAYQYLCVGNFFDDAHTTTVVTCPGCSYNLFGYYVDDVSVSRTEITSVPSFSNNKPAQLEFFPNPSDGRFRLSVDLFEKEEIHIKIMNANGVCVSSEKLIGLSGRYSQDMDLSSYEKGIYLICVQQGSRLLTQKIVIR